MPRLLSLLRFTETVSVGAALVLTVAFSHLPQVWLPLWIMGGVADCALALLEGRVRRAEAEAREQARAGVPG